MILHLFGPIAVQIEGRLLPSLLSRKAGWMLALLALRHGREVERAWLAGLLWPDSDHAQGLYNVRRTLVELRDLLGSAAPRLCSSAPHTLALDLTGAHADVLAFDAAIARGDEASLECAVELRRGPLLEGCCEEWALQERSPREEAYLAALEKLAAHATARGDLERAVLRLRQVIAVEPFRESAQQALLQALAARGDSAAATVAYRAFERRLRKELGCEPAPEMTALFHQLRAPVRGRHCTPYPLPPTPAASLPCPISRFVGREQALRSVRDGLQKSRLVTLTGPGGVGKTRLAIQVAHEVAGEYRDGAGFADLARLSDPTLVPQVVATLLAVREQPDQPLSASLQAFLGGKELLLVLDNCEHVLAACAGLAEALLSTCPALRILATSRQSLGPTGEVAWRVPPLSLPAGEGVGCRVWGVGGNQSAPHTLHPTPYTLLESDAVRLFVERAADAAPDFRLTERNAPGVVRICRQLEGIPLAIELAAARLKALSVEEIAARLEDRFGLLTGGSCTALPRHQTLRAAMDWSYALLSEPERALLRALSVFPGTFALLAVEAVWADEVLDLLAALVDKSLVMVEATVCGVRPSVLTSDGPGTEHDPPPTETRYRLLETVRQYARERWAPEEWRALGGRHAQHYLSLAETAWSHPSETERLDRLEREHDNLRAAVDWCLKAADTGWCVEMALRLGAALGWFWNLRGYWQEGRARLAAILGLETTREECLPPRLQVERAHVLDRAGDLAKLQNDDPAAREWYEQALAIYRRLNDRLGIAHACLHLGDMARRRDEWQAARTLLTEALTVFEEQQQPVRALSVLAALGQLAEDEGDHPTARTLYEQCLSFWRGRGDCLSVMVALQDLGRLAYLDGDTGTAKAHFSESLEMARALGIQHGIAIVQYVLGSLARLEEEYAAAAAYHQEGLALYRELGDEASIAGSLAALAFAVHRQGDGERAAALFHEALRLNRKLGSRRRTALCLEGLAGLAALEGSGVRGQGIEGEGLGVRGQGLVSHPDGSVLTPNPQPLTPAVLTPDPSPLTPRLLAARLFGAAAALREGDTPRWPADQADYERNLAALRARLDAEALASAWAEGAALPLEEAIALGLAVQGRS